MAGMTHVEYLDHLAQDSEAGQRQSAQRQERMRQILAVLARKQSVDGQVEELVPEMLALTKQEAEWSAPRGNRELNLMEVGRKFDLGNDEEWEDYRPHDMGSPGPFALDQLKPVERFVFDAAVAAGYRTTVEWKWFPPPAIDGGRYMIQVAW